LFDFKDNRGHFYGVVVNGIPQYFAEFEVIAKNIVNCIPGLSGYVGIDLVLSEGGPLVIEINPRLTTAYAGLRQSLGKNPAEWILSTFRTGHIQDIGRIDCIPVTVRI
jgi:Predicted ATP-utilizing enzyme (ATP-grasp superfamily)